MTNYKTSKRVLNLKFYHHSALLCTMLSNFSSFHNTLACFPTVLCKVALDFLPEFPTGCFMESSTIVFTYPHQQIGLLKLRKNLVKCYILNIVLWGAETGHFGKVRNAWKFCSVVLENDGKHHLGRSCEKWRSITKSQGGEKSYKQKIWGRLTGLITSFIWPAF